MRKSPDVLYARKKMKNTPKKDFEEQLKNMALREQDILLLMDIQSGLSSQELCTKYCISQGGLSKKQRRLMTYLHQFDAANALI